MLLLPSQTFIFNFSLRCCTLSARLTHGKSSPVHTRHTWTSPPYPHGQSRLSMDHPAPSTLDTHESPRPIHSLFHTGPSNPTHTHHQVSHTCHRVNFGTIQKEMIALGATGTVARLRNAQCTRGGAKGCPLPTPRSKEEEQKDAMKKGGKISTPYAAAVDEESQRSNRNMRLGRTGTGATANAEAPLNITDAVWDKGHYERLP